ncbi:MAG: hypothetical protein IH898_08250 [Planctomycetes bacterium]|nr:hypothetical protein [Planctomycetota bacterium]
MTKRATRDNSSSVGLFPFLAVLLCTMGALLVLLVVLAQNAGQRVAAENRQAPTVELELAAAAELARQLEEVHQYQQKLQQLREQGESRLHDEQQRLSHLEEHARRLEHELAQLSLAAQQLEATEKNQLVDREQAERELERLQQLIADTEKQLEELREQASGKHSYAIVPYQGQNGTYRKPIYIECCAEGIILQPEGLRFQPTDFADLSWPGNPLAAALRASREYLISQAARAGEPEPPDPYPLILVRPEGITQYLVARRAITSWGSDFGYEFIDSDWKLDFPDLPDPQLARAQQHAVIIARERLARLAQAAPSRFRGIGSGNGMGRGSSGSGGTGSGFEGSPDEGSLARAGGGNSATGNGSTAGAQGQPAAGESASTDGEYQFGALSGDSSQGDAGGANSYAGSPGGQSAAGESASADGATGGTQSGQPGLPSGTARPYYGQAGGSVAGATADSGGPSGAMGQPGNPTEAEARGSPSLQFTAGQSSIAESRGSDWAVQRAMRGAVPIRRPIQVVVRKNQMALLPSRHATRGTEATGVVISLDQPLDRVSNEFVAALKVRIDEWGLAGNGLYWRPVLELHVGPDAGRTASKLMQLLKNSGVEVRLPETAQAQQGERTHAPR